MKRRCFTAACFSLVGFASIFAWASIDAKLCETYANFCKPKPGFCGGIDVCSADVHVIAGLALILVAPPVLFGILGYLLAGRNARQLFSWGAVAIVVHWTLTLVGTRVLPL
jgi:hypothetical protein